MSLCAVECILQTKLTSLNTWPSPGFPRMTILSASPVQTIVHCVADLLTSSHPQMSASHLLGLQVRANRPSQLSYQSTCIVTWGATNQDMLLYRKSRIWGCYKLRYVTKQEILLLAILLYLFAVYKCLHGKYFNTQCLARPSYIG